MDNRLKQLIFGAMLGGLALWLAIADARAQEPFKQPVDFTAESLEHDEARQIVTARGRVEMVQAGRRLTADMVQYDLASDTAMASGSVTVYEPDGSVYAADRMQLTDDLKNGFVEHLYGVMPDGSRFWASRGDHKDGTKTVMADAVYTPCAPCQADPSAAPDWQLRAREVSHDKEDARITYRDARLEMFGVPVFYTPYFSHPDGTVEQKSGLLAPSMGLDSELGGSYWQKYYWAIAPDKDATIGVEAYTKEKPRLTGEYRQRFEKGALMLEGGATYSDRPEQRAGGVAMTGDEWRGHLFAQGVYNIDDQWRAGLNARIVSDDQYTRQYNVSGDEVLESELYAERFDERDYAVIRAMGFQDVRISARRRDQPMILPEIQAGFKGDPNATLGGRWSLDGSFLGLERDGSGQDMIRGTLEAGWQRRDVAPAGIVSTVDLTLRGDLYNVRDRMVAVGTGRTSEANTMRGFAQANWQASLPLVRHFQDSGTQWVVEPIVSLTTGTNVKLNSDVPNEDSQDLFLDAPKLFEANRFAGYDRIEDGSRATYGLRTGLHGAEGWGASVFAGQSYRLNKDPALFPGGSGLSERRSDYVGSVDVNYGRKLALNYRFQIDSDTLAARRHEVTASTVLDPVSLYSTYFYSTPLAGTDLTLPREQLYVGADVRITDQWSVSGGTQYDFGADEGLRRGHLGILYEGQCITLGLSGERKLTRTVSGDSGTEIMLRIGLKNLGEYEGSLISLRDDGE